MAIEVAKYQFLSWARKGIAAHINEPDTLGNPGAALPPGDRATVPVGVSINSSPQTPKDFGLIGAGDIVGVHRDMIVRTEPRNWATGFEPNYLAFIEFYDEDFPWRYTPAKPQGDKLRPWLFLLVLKESEFSRDDRRLPLPVVKVKSKDPFPPVDETWLFAHVHTEEDIGGTYSTLELYLKSLQKEITTDPDKVYSRLLSPRHLEPNQAYHAFLVPAFEAGRLVGLGQPNDGIPAQQPAWNASTAGLELPFYFDWFFRTGEQYDFESLVQLILPRVLDEKVGMRKMDCSTPGFVSVDAAGRELPVAPGDPPGLPPAAPPIQGLEGALKTERTLPLPKTFTPNAFQDELQTLVNLPQTVATDLTAPAGTEQDFLNDPVVTVPFYGQNHARQHKGDSILLDVTQSGWYHALNRDPRTRVPAGFGTSVVQKHQEKFMQKAWQQVNRIYEANRKMRQYQFMIQVSLRYESRHFATLPASKLLAVTSAVHSKVLGSPTTIRHQLSESRLGLPVFAPAFRRLTRPAGHVARRLGASGAPLDFPRLVGALNEDRVTPAPPRTVPEGIPSVDDLARRIQPHAPSAWLRWLMDHRVFLLLALLVLLAFVGFATGLWAAVGVAAAAGVAGFQWLRNQASADAAATSLVDPTKAIAEIEATPPQPAFNVMLEGETTMPPATPSAVAGAGADSVEAANFRGAALNLAQRAAIRPPAKPPLAAFDLDNGHLKIARAIHPAVSFPRRLSALVKLPGRPITTPEEIVDVMTHPDIDDPMYAHLRDINKELLIPNLQLIPPNTIALLETNPPFIESYMVGLNHEMARELLWREYPTDLRGSYFRQFWDVKGISAPATPAAAELLKDITKIHTWQAPSALGSHKPQPPAGSDVQPGEKQLVLVIRGELLKRYPNTVIYAQKAMIVNGSLVISTEDLDEVQFKRHYKFPQFRAEIESDLRFFGFDLTLRKAKGLDESVDFKGDKAGWFFIIQEVPGEPRFGMDISYQPTRDSNTDATDDPLDTWDNLAWNSFGATQPQFVRRTPPPKMPRPDNDVLKKNPWGVNAAHMAFILYQSPVMVAVHATEMLDKA